MGKNKDKDIKAIIQEAVKEALKASKIVGLKTSTNAYKDTEKRLYAYPVLLQKIKEDKEKLKDLELGVLQETSKGITRFIKSGIRLDKEEILEALIQDLEATIQADIYEVQTIEKALKNIKQDTYFKVVEGKFINNLHDDEIAKEIPCDPSTVRRNRGRLVKKIAILLYGVQAI